MATAARHTLNARFAAPALPNRHATTTRRPRPRAADQPKLIACPRTRRRSRSTRPGAMLRAERTGTGLPEKPGIASPQGTSAVGAVTQPIALAARATPREVPAAALFATGKPSVRPSATLSVAASTATILRRCACDIVANPSRRLEPHTGPASPRQPTDHRPSSTPAPRPGCANNTRTTASVEKRFGARCRRPRAGARACALPGCERQPRLGLTRVLPPNSSYAIRGDRGALVA